MTSSKKFTACIYLYRTHAVTTLQDMTIVDTDPVRLARHYSDHNIDDLIVFDLSATDEEHEEALDIIKDICASVQVDVCGAGNVHRMEDIKKLLYAGCKRAVLDYENPENIAITQEVSQKFGKDKIVISYNDYHKIEEHKELAETYASSLLLMNAHMIRETAAVTDMPLTVQINQLALNKLLEIFAYDNVMGVTGNTINNNVKDILTLKELCKENGIPVETLEAAYQWSDFKLNSDGMLPVVVQDCVTSEVLMVAYMNEEAYRNTLRTGKMTYFLSLIHI